MDPEFSKSKTIIIVRRCFAATQTATKFFVQHLLVAHIIIFRTAFMGDPYNNNCKEMLRSHTYCNKLFRTAFIGGPYNNKANINKPNAFS